MKKLIALKLSKQIISNPNKNNKFLNKVNKKKSCHKETGLFYRKLIRNKKNQILYLKRNRFNNDLNIPG